MTNFPEVTILGYPNIGENREFKFVTEKFFRKEIDEKELDSKLNENFLKAIEKISLFGLDQDFQIPDTWTYYDRVLDLIHSFNIIPERFSHLQGTDLYFALARGDKNNAPLSMKKWLNSNYHYLVPEFSKDIISKTKYLGTKLISRFKLFQEKNIKVRPTIVGPWTLLSGAHYLDEGINLFSEQLIEKIVKLYRELLLDLEKNSIEWVQIDEPNLINENLPYSDQEKIKFLEQVYPKIFQDLKIQSFLSISYGYPNGEILEQIKKLPINALGLDLYDTKSDQIDFEQLKSFSDSNIELVFGIQNSRLPWANDFVKAELFDNIKNFFADFAISPATSYQHIPITKNYETEIKQKNSQLFEQLSFADEKILELIEVSKTKLLPQRNYPEFANEKVQTQVKNIKESDFQRSLSFEERSPQQIKTPLFPLTTIGSFPQTSEIRNARKNFKNGEISQEQYDEVIAKEIKFSVDIQEKLGFDVLVHGESERNDMVQYFCEQLEGCQETLNGWVQSYGTRCTKPSLIYGDISRTNAMTVRWSKYAQSLTEKPMKGMLTGPVTIMAWSFIRNDISQKDIALQLGLALKEEVLDLEKNGIKVIQVDEPAIRETLPLVKNEHADYYDWAVNSFKLATSSVQPSTQIHSHFCYSEFNSIVDILNRLDADVISIEASRSKMQIVSALSEFGYQKGIGPGVYDIHSPRIPSVEEVEKLIEYGIKNISNKKLLWVNPDCGLKTRTWAEVEPSLDHMAQATFKLREKYQV